MFSPYYAWARRRSAAADPADHCAVNVALYGPRGKRWAMTERARGALHRDRSTLHIGPSRMHWDGNALTVDLDEITAPLPSRIRGTVRVIPRALVDYIATLDAAQRHRWQPIAPEARVEVALESPALRWNGDGYWDSNHGDEALERSIRHWTWSRGTLREGTAVIYDVTERSGAERALALRFGPQGDIADFPKPPPSTLPRTGWRIARLTRSDDGIAIVERTLEDTPFYARSVIRSRLLGEPVTSVHESLDLDRFRSPIVQAMLPFRMPRRR